MKTTITSRKLFVVAFLLIVATNIIILTGAILNRSTGKIREITLTQREFWVPYTNRENSGLSIRPIWRTLGAYKSEPPSWLDVKKLIELGFDTKDINSRLKSRDDKHINLFAKEVFIVLEYNGKLYKESIQRAKLSLQKNQDLLKLNSDDERLQDKVKEAKLKLQKERTEASRLFAIDAGLDPKILIKKYSDQTRYIVTKGLVKPRYNYDDLGKVYGGYIQGLSVSNIHVPLTHRQPFNNHNNNRNSKKDHSYKVTLAYGSRHEPWIVETQEDASSL